MMTLAWIYIYISLDDTLVSTLLSVDLWTLVFCTGADDYVDAMLDWIHWYRWMFTVPLCHLLNRA